MKLRKTSNRPEQIAQGHIAEWLGKVELYSKGEFFFFHVPNGGYRSGVEAAIFQGMGVRAGVPDLVICMRGGKTIFIELKILRSCILKAGGISYAKEAKPSPDQDKIHATLRGLGFVVETVAAKHGADAIQQISVILKREGLKGQW